VQLQLPSVACAKHEQRFSSVFPLLSPVGLWLDGSGWSLQLRSMANQEEPIAGLKGLEDIGIGNGSQ
jgi:hypothetical protein